MAASSMAASLRIVADANIPQAAEAFGRLGRVRLLPGQAITPAALAEADVLLVRSVTRVDEALLEGSPVRFVGSATIGTDHVELGYLARRGIAFAHAPGSNAASVVGHVLAALLAVFAERGERLLGKTVGVVGCGHIGGVLAARLPALGLRVLRNDPPLAEAGRKGLVPLERVLAEADVISLHVPLTRGGPHPTFHLIGEGELAAMRPGALLVNTARGAVVDNAALRAALEAGRLGGAVLDVWEGEPEPSPALLALTSLATPHIAGYSYDGKIHGTAMLYDALTGWLGEAPAWSAEAALAPEPGERLALVPPDPALGETAWLDALVRQAYDIRADDARMRAMLDLLPAERGAYFHRLRKTYPRRRDFDRFSVPDVPGAYRRAVHEGLGMGA